MKSQKVKLAAVVPILAVAALAVAVDGAPDDQRSSIEATTTTLGPPGRTLTAAEKAASSDCVPLDQYKRQHDGYPPPYLLIKRTDGSPAERLPFDRAYALAEAGDAWTHAACQSPRKETPTP